MDGLMETPLYKEHIALGAQMIDFGGWALPVQYTGILAEHKAVRESAGLFDVSHMGEICVFGPQALAFLQRILTNDMRNLAVGRARYSPMCYDDGTTVDDVLVYCNDDAEYVMVVNAANIDKDWDWCLEHTSDIEMLENRSAKTAQLALQGPKYFRVLERAGVEGVMPEKYYSFNRDMSVGGIPCVISRTGYTGEAGVEIYCEAEDAPQLFRVLLEAGKPLGLLPCGLGARDTLRFEACMPLYGHELSDEITPLEAGLGMFVKMDKGDFVGREALSVPPKRRRIGLEMLERGIAREGCRVCSMEGKPLGAVTSGMPSPTLGKNLAMAMVEAGAPKEGETVLVQVRSKTLKAQVTAMPFYKRRD